MERNDNMYKGLTLLAAILILAVGIGSSSSNKRAYVAGRFALAIDGEVSGFLDSVEGGAEYAEPVWCGEGVMICTWPPSGSPGGVMFLHVRPLSRVM